MNSGENASVAMMRDCYLGVDGGGTHTRAVIVDRAGRLLGSGFGGSTNHHDYGAAAVEKNLADTVNAALSGARGSSLPVKSVVMGLGGILSHKDEQVLIDISERLGLAQPGGLHVLNDSEIGLAGGLSGRPGIVQIAGTGANSFGCNPAGERTNAGGWGHILADEGSGYWFGWQALRAAVQAFDGRGPETILKDRVQAALGIDNFKDIMFRVYVQGLNRSQTAALAPIVFQSALEGDRAALRIEEWAADELSHSIAVVARQLKMDQGPIEIALSGGVFTSAAFVQILTTAIQRRLPQARVTLPELPAVFGACLLALKFDGVEIGDEILENLHLAANAVFEPA